MHDFQNLVSKSTMFFRNALHISYQGASTRRERTVPVLVSRADIFLCRAKSPRYLPRRKYLGGLARRKNVLVRFTSGQLSLDAVKYLVS
jgi:hypothetical protein